MGQHRDPVRKGQALTSLGPRGLQRLWRWTMEREHIKGNREEQKPALRAGFGCETGFSSLLTSRGTGSV